MNKYFSATCLFTTAVLSLGGLTARAQQAAAPLLRLEAAPQRGISEKLFVHTDKTAYMAGDVLWFKVYSVDAWQHRPLDLSKVAYVDILDKSNTPVAQVKVALQARGSGSLQLPLSLQSGLYKLRGYTSWMRNAGPGAFFEQVVTIINPLKSPEAARGAARPAYAVTFFPEGGQMVQGLESRLAFKIIDTTGRGVEGSGVVVSGAGDTLARFATHTFGMGAFSLRPQAGQTYKALLTTATGELFTQSLPAAIAQGYTMRLDEDAAGSLTLSVQTNEPGGDGTPLYLLTHTRGVSGERYQAVLSGGAARFAINKGKLPEGVTQLTLFTARGQAVGERLYFKRPAAGGSLTARSDAARYAPRSKVALAIQAAGSSPSSAADLSLSVYRLDSLQGARPADIAAYLWLTSELSGAVESPGYYLSATTPDAAQAADLLMLTHGWRRLKQPQASAPPALYPLEYNGQLVSARIVDTRTGAPAAGVPAYLSVPGLHFQFYTGHSDSSGLVRFDVKDVYGASELVLQIATPGPNPYRFEVLSPFASRASADSLPAFRLAAAPPLLESYSIAMQAQNVYHADSLRRFTPPLLSDTLPFYGKSPYSYALDDYTRFTTMEEVLREYVFQINVTLRGGKLYLHMLDEDRRQYFEDKVLVLVDGVPLVDKNKIFDYDPHKVRRLDVIPKGYLLGPNYFKGVASFITYNGDMKGFTLDPGALMVAYEGLQLQREFYAPVYETAAQKASRLPDLRTTLLWKPNLTTDDQGAASVNFYTSDTRGSYIGVLQGLDAQGRPAATTFAFEVK